MPKVLLKEITDRYTDRLIFLRPLFFLTSPYTRVLSAFGVIARFNIGLSMERITVKALDSLAQTD